MNILTLYSVNLPDADHVHGLDTWTSLEVVDWREVNTRVRGCENGHWQIALWTVSAWGFGAFHHDLTYRMGNVVHAKVEPQNEILVSQRLAIEELIEVNGRVGLVHGVEDVSRSRFCLLCNGEHEISLSPSCGVEKHIGVFNGKVASACVWHDLVRPVFSVSGLLILVQDKHFLWSRRLPIKAALVFCFKETPFQLHRAVLSTL